jgi:GrpB-like predicted nucleotidyltransferase (UPF0157 family)
VERYGGGPIVVRDHDPVWCAMFAEERARLLAPLGSMPVTIEHVGSTAVPGLAAKPIIDLLVGVRSLAEARVRAVAALGAPGYAHVREYEAWLPDELLFRKGVPGPWTHHVHVMEPTSPRWEEFVLFRDDLLGHRDVVGAYGDPKKALAFVFGDDIRGFRNAFTPVRAGRSGEGKGREDERTIQMRSPGVARCD